VREQAAPPSTLDEELAPEIDAIVMKALTKKVDDRYQSAAAMRADIERYLAGKPVTAPAVVPPDDATAFVPADSSFLGGTREVDDDDRRKKRWPLVLTVLGVLVLLALAAVLGPMLLDRPPETKAVPDVVNLTRTEAESRIKAAGLSVGEVREEANEDVAKGRVVSQDPRPTTSLPPGDAVDLVVSTGTPDVVVPYVIGEDKDTARQKITDAGLKVKLVRKESDAEKDTVISTDPNPADTVSKGRLVTIFFSAGPQDVPSVVGMKEAKARATLKDAGFEVDVVQDSQTKADKGTVLKQSPAAFTTQPQGTTVVITVSTYEKPTETPTPTPSKTPSPSPSESPSVTVSPSTPGPE